MYNSNIEPSTSPFPHLQPLSNVNLLFLGDQIPNVYWWVPQNRSILYDQYAHQPQSQDHTTA